MFRTDLMAARILKEHGHILSSEECKDIVECVEDKDALVKAIMQLGAPFNISEADALTQLLGDMDEDHYFEKDGDLWKDDVLDKYAEYVFNYEYQYNDKAKEVDPETDTSEHHIGPMAQDLEKVNPAVVKEDASGYKVVDTGRLALMNAGAIADLAREIREIKNGNES